MTETELLTEQIERAIQSVSLNSGEYFRAMVHALSPGMPFDSPLEKAFYIWWMAADFCFRDYHESFGGISCAIHQEVVIDGDRYIIDFVISPDSPDIREHWTPVAVEVDGHAFHERTPEQVRTRDKRDRALQKAGWKVFHFSFSEFMANPDDCLNEVVNFVRDAILGIMRSGRE